MRFGSVRLFAAVLLCCTPAIAMAATPKNKPAVSKSNGAKAPAAQAQGKKARSVAKAPKYNAPIYSAIVVDAATGQVLSEVNADTKGYPASLTKMMTLYMLFEALERGQVSNDSIMPVSARAMNAAPSKLNLTRKSRLTVEQAIGALITKSANDVAIVTAEFLGGGSEDVFAERMTARARALGMTQTTFMNASGLPNPGQISSARDMSILANHLIKDYPQYYGQFGRMEYAYQGQTIRTHNRLLEFYEGADGIKTGYTAASGFNLVGSATRNGYRIIGVIFGGATANARDRKLAELMDQGFAVVSGGQAAEPLIAGNTTDRNADRIGAQIALAQPAAAPTEQGDADSAYTPNTRSGVSIETTSLPPLPSAVAAQTKMAALTPTPKATPTATPSTDTSAATAGVQIGAYADRAKAQMQADAAAAKVKTAFSGATAVVMAVKSGSKMIYRARVMGLGDDDLMQACGLIPAKIKAGACQAIRPEQVAANQ